MASMQVEADLVKILGNFGSLIPNFVTKNIWLRALKVEHLLKVPWGLQCFHELFGLLIQQSCPSYPMAFS